MDMVRFRVMTLVTLPLAVNLIVICAAVAQPFPSRTITIVVPTAPALSVGSLQVSCRKVRAGASALKTRSAPSWRSVALRQAFLIAESLERPVFALLGSRLPKSLRTNSIKLPLFRDCLQRP